MRIVAIPLFAAALCAPAFAAPVRAPMTPPYLELAANRDVPPPIHYDLDGDGYWTELDCNDDDAAVHPMALETANAVDDNCDGVVDDGFDTSVDWPTVKVVGMLWPTDPSPPNEEWISLKTEPRIVRAKTGLTAVWTDLGRRLRLARLDATGGLLDASPLVLRKDVGAADVAWTGTRYGVVYEDLSAFPPDVRLATLDADGETIVDVLVAADAREPRLAWGQDRFGVVWSVGDCVGDCLRFQRFDRDARVVGLMDVIPNSGSDADVAFSRTGVVLGPDGWETHVGSFGVVYQAGRGYESSHEVWLAIQPLESYGASASLRIDTRESEATTLGVRPSIGANPTGFAVCWHAVEEGRDGARARFVPLDTLDPIQPFAPDADAGRDSRIAWTGNDFVVVNDNIVHGSPEGLEVHFRRLDPSGNSHLAAGWGPWTELNLSDGASGGLSASPAIADQGQGFGVVWVEEEAGTSGTGRIWFSFVVHR